MDIAVKPENLPPCPSCGARTCVVYEGFAVTGPALVAGVTTKLSATPALGWRCTTCKAHGRAHPPADAGKEVDQ